MEWAVACWRECSSPTICAVRNRCGQVEQLREYAVDYNLTLKETEAAVPMWLPDWSLVARLESLNLLPPRKYSRGGKGLAGGGWGGWWWFSGLQNKKKKAPANISQNAFPHVAYAARQKEGRMHAPRQMCPHTHTLSPLQFAFSHLSLPRISYRT